MLQRTHKHVFGLAIFIVYAIILDKYIHFVLGTELLTVVIEVAEWALLFVLVAYFLTRKRGRFSKALILLFAIKIAVVAMFFREFNFQKNILLLIALNIYTFQSQEFRLYCRERIGKHYWTLLVLLLMSFVPFAPFYNRYFAEVDASAFSDVRRFSGLWELPHVYAYIVLAMMTLQIRKSLFLNVLLMLNIVATGVRSAIFAAGIYAAWLVTMQIKETGQFLRRVLLVSVFTIPLLFLTGVDRFVKDQYVFHIAPLLEEDISNPSYGKGRYIFNFIALSDMQQFSVLELIAGRSATAMYKAFDEFLGMKSWPHNDYVTVAYIYGLMGILLFIYAVNILPFKRVDFSLRSDVSAIATIIFVLAVTNGYYTYHSVYLFAIAQAIHYDCFVLSRQKSQRSLT